MNPSTKSTQILWCRCQGGDIPREMHHQIRDALIESGLDTIQVSDLCGAAALHTKKLRDAVLADDLLVIGCYPRAMRALLHRAGIDGNVSLRFLNQRTDTPEEIRDAITGIIDATPSDVSAIVIDDEGGWIPWYPVIDYQRCKNCKQCADFCIFGAYGIDDERKIFVQNPQNCKTNCPACARICPEAAIIFPKHDESPINGDTITDEEAVREKIKLNMDEILGDDVYATLAERRKKAHGLKLKRQALEKARAERATYTND